MDRDGMKTSVTYSKNDIAEMIRDAKNVCKANQVRPTEGNLRRIITDEHGEAVAEQVFAKPATAGKTKPTVADLQEAVNTTEATMKKAKKVDARAAKSAKKQVANGKRPLKPVLGYPVVAVARAFGKAGFKPAVAVAAIHTVEPRASVAAIRTFVQAGRHGLRGTPAPVSKKALKELVAAADA